MGRPIKKKYFTPQSITQLVAFANVEGTVGRFSIIEQVGTTKFMLDQQGDTIFDLVNKEQADLLPGEMLIRSKDDEAIIESISWAKAHTTLRNNDPLQQQWYVAMEAPINTEGMVELETMFSDFGSSEGPVIDPIAPGPMDIILHDEVTDMTSFEFGLASPNAIFGIAYKFTGTPVVTVTHGGELLDIVSKKESGDVCVIMAVGTGLTVEVADLEVAVEGGSIGPLYMRINELPEDKGTPSIAWVVSDANVNPASNVFQNDVDDVRSIMAINSASNTYNVELLPANKFNRVAYGTVGGEDIGSYNAAIPGMWVTAPNQWRIVDNTFVKVNGPNTQTGLFHNVRGLYAEDMNPTAMTVVIEVSDDLLDPANLDIGMSTTLGVWLSPISRTEVDGKIHVLFESKNGLNQLRLIPRPANSVVKSVQFLFETAGLTYFVDSSTSEFVAPYTINQMHDGSFAPARVMIGINYTPAPVTEPEPEPEIPEDEENPPLA